MFRRFTMASLLLLGSAFIAGYPAMSRADDPKPGDPQAPAGEAKNIESKREKAPPIPDFARVYRVPLESISTLGQRLADARQKCDPVALALIATEIKVAETVSGKTAEVTGDEVAKEAITLGKMRRREKELMALALLVKDPAQAEGLNSLAQTARAEEAERISRFKSGERDKGIHVLVVKNTTPVPVSIRVNGNHLGWVQGYGQADFNTSQFYEPDTIFLSAHDQFGDVFRSEYHTGHHHYFVWTLVDQN